jgi:hypothetical protein
VNTSNTTSAGIPVLSDHDLHCSLFSRHIFWNFPKMINGFVQNARWTSKHMIFWVIRVYYQYVFGITKLCNVNLLFWAYENISMLEHSSWFWYREQVFHQNLLYLVQFLKLIFIISWLYHIIILNSSVIFLENGTNNNAFAPSLIFWNVSILYYHFKFFNYNCNPLNTMQCLTADKLIPSLNLPNR